MSSLKRSLVLLSFVLTMAISSGHAQQPSKLKVPLAFTDHMVLQNGVEDPVWGTALAGTMVKVDFLDAQNKNLASLQAVADSDGKWSVKLPPLTTGTTGELQIIAGTEAPVVVHDVVVGEAWLCSGQSNMGYTINSPNMPPEWVARAQQEATDAKGNIRFYDGKWEIGTPDTVGRCSAVAWNFAVALHDKLHCPIGLLVEASPGTPVERWMLKAAVDATSVGPAIEKRYQDDAAKFPDLVKQANEADAAWLQANPTPELQAQHKGSRPKKPYRIIHVGELFNWYIQGLVPYGIKGVTWFQADANRAHPEEYGELFKALITSWRQLWQTQLPFYYVEMNNMLAPQQTKPIEPGWLPILREQQEAGLELPGVEVVTSIDTGDPVAVVMQPHFPNKKPVGERLALLALNNLYGMPCEAHSPQYASFTVEGNKIRVKFKYADGLRVRGGGKMIGFAIRGATGDWVWADGQIDGTDILLSSDQVPQPASVRYAWAFNPLISVENGAGLPLRPFRTDKTSQE